MEFVTFEIAKKLKEKGFREKCLAYYDCDDNVGLQYNTEYTDNATPCQYTDLLQSHNTETMTSQLDDSENCVDAPTISQALKWFRDVMKAEIETFLYDGTYSYYIKSVAQIDEDDRFHQCLNDDTTDEEYETYEEAAIAGINYYLDNLM